MFQTGCRYCLCFRMVAVTLFQTSFCCWLCFTLVTVCVSVRLFVFQAGCCYYFHFRLVAVYVSDCLLLLFVFRAGCCCCLCFRLVSVCISGWLLLLVLLIALHLSDIPAHTSVQSVVRFVQHVRMPQYSEVLAVVSGRWLSPANCRITWGWQEPQTVGGTFSFLVEVDPGLEFFRGFKETV